VRYRQCTGGLLQAHGGQKGPVLWIRNFLLDPDTDPVLEVLDPNPETELDFNLNKSRKSSDLVKKYRYLEKVFSFHRRYKKSVFCIKLWFIKPFFIS
jgi:hypothetical protein